MVRQLLQVVVCAVADFYKYKKDVEPKAEIGNYINMELGQVHDDGNVLADIWVNEKCVRDLSLGTISNCPDGEVVCIIKYWK